DWTRDGTLAEYAAGAQPRAAARRRRALIRAGGTLVSIVGPSEARPADGLAVDFVVESDRAQLSEIVQRVRDGRLRTNIGNISTLDEEAARVRVRLLRELAANREALVATHLSFPSVCHVAVDGDVFRWVPGP